MHIQNIESYLIKVYMYNNETNNDTNLTQMDFEFIIKNKIKPHQLERTSKYEKGLYYCT